MITSSFARRVAALAAAAFTVLPLVNGGAQARADEPAADQPPEMADLVSPRLISERRALVRGMLGEYLAVTFKIADGWHLYWQNPGDSGSPIEVKITGPEGIEVGEVLWPTPSRIVAGDHLNYGYEERATLIIPIRVTDAFKGDTATFTADLSWVVCREECLFDQAQITLELPVLKDRAGASNSPDTPLVWQGRYALPGPPPEGLNVFYKTRWQDGALVIHADGAAEITFFPLEPDAPVDMLEKGKVAGDTLTLQFKPESLTPEQLPGQRVRGVAHIKRHNIEWRINVDVPVPRR